jgi:magnesium transporter
VSEPAQPDLQSLCDQLAAGELDQLNQSLRALPIDDAARWIDRLDDAQQGEVLNRLQPELVAALITQLPPGRGASLLETMEPAAVAGALRHLPSNDQVDLLAELPEKKGDILAAMPVEAAQRLVRLLTYPEGTAGGLMVNEYLTYHAGLSVAEVIDDLRANAERYARFDVQYAYVLDEQARLIGTLRLRDLLLMSLEQPIQQAMIQNPQTITAETTLDQLQRKFDRLGYLGLPVVDEERRVLGVVLRNDVEEALADRSERTYLLMSGLLGGEELRSMRWTHRIARRAPWLAVSLLLSTLAASVIGWYEETLAAVIALAACLPVISGVGGNAGNQSMALSIRELSLGLIEPDEFAWVIGKEALVALMNGLLMAILLGTIVVVWQRNLTLGFVVGLAILASTVLAAVLGGVVPLALRRLGWDPALASGPILFTTVDLCGFLFTLTLADLILT